MNMKLIRQRIYILFLMLPSIAAGGEISNLGSSFLKIGLGARPVGMAGAFVPVADNSDAIFWNPAGLGRLENAQFSFTHAQWFQHIQFEALSGARPIGKNLTMGIGVRYLHTGELERRFSAADIEPTGTFHTGQLNVDFSFAGSLPIGLCWGINAKFLQQQIDYYSAVGSAVDVGLLAVTPFDDLRLGVALHNFGTNLKFIDDFFTLPSILRAGIAKSFFNELLMISGQGNFQRAYLPKYQLGTEVQFDAGSQSNPVALMFRAGYQWQDERNLHDGYSAGFGLSLLHSNVWYQLDYAYQPYGILGETHHISLSLKTNRAFKVDAQADPPRFSPNNDGIADWTEFELKVENLKNAISWKLIIFTHEKQILNIFSDQGLPPASVRWNGTDKYGQVLPEGKYRYALSVVRRDGKAAYSAKKIVQIDLTGPIIDALAKPDYILLSGKQELPEIKFELSALQGTNSSTTDRIKDWKLTVFDLQKQIVKSFSQTGNLPPEISWDGKTNQDVRIKEGSYLYLIKAWDFLGNEGKSTVKQINIKREKSRYVKRFQFTIENVMFDTDKATLRYDGMQALQKVVKVLFEHPGCLLHIEGHTDSRGTDEYNMTLSLARGNTVGMFLMQHAQLTPDRMTVVPYGESRPKAPNNTEFGMQLNRRVEISVFVKE